MNGSDKFDSGELESIENLLRDFASNADITPDHVYKEAWIRYGLLAEDVPSWSNFFQDKIYVAPRVLHLFIYQGLFNFAGKYRQSKDPEGGRIGFGGVKQNQHKLEFYGSHPTNIEQEVQEAIDHLTNDSESECIDHVARFYQRFVLTHPFYDGNGRIARLISNMFLYKFKKHIAWGEFDNRNDFIRKLNLCHRNPTPENFDILKSKFVVLDLADEDKVG